MKPFTLAVVAAFVPLLAAASPEPEHPTSLADVERAAAEGTADFKANRSKSWFPLATHQGGVRTIAHIAVRRAENLSVVEFDDLCYMRKVRILPYAQAISCVAVSFDAFYLVDGQERKLDKRLIAFVSPPDGSHPDRVLNDAVRMKEILNSLGAGSMKAANSVDVLIKKDPVAGWELTGNSEDRAEFHVADEMIVTGGETVNGDFWNQSDTRVFKAPFWISHLRKLQ